MPRESLAVTRAVLGLAQGAALYLLYVSADSKIWPATDSLAFAPLALTATAIPALAIAGLGNLRWRNFAIWIAAATVIVAGLSAYDIFHDPAGGLSGAFSTETGRAPSAPLWLSTAAGLFIAHALIVSGDADRAWIAKYPRYFDVAWKQAVQAALAGAFVGALWVLLFLGAALFRLIEIRFFSELLQKQWFSIPVTTLAFAIAIHVTDVQAGLVRGVRTLKLTLLSWLLPLIALISAGFLLTLLFTGLGPLWETRHATYVVLSTAAGLIVLTNAAYQDGLREHRAAFVLQCAGTVAAIALTPLVVIAAYAVILRVTQYGWTADRVVACASVVVAACYAAGYGVAAMTRGPWLQRIETANVATAVVILAVILALFTPLADPTRLAVADQVARLESGATPADKFDYAFLRFRGGRYGMAALERLQQKQDGPDAARIVEKATAALAAKNQSEASRNTDQPGPADRAANILLAYPKGQQMPASFLQYNWNVAPDPWRQPNCLTGHMKCDAVMLDLDGDGAAEILLSGGTYGFIAYKETGGKWAILGDVQSSNCTGVREALLSGDVEIVTPKIKEISAAGARLQVQTGRACPQ